MMAVYTMPFDNALSLARRLPWRTRDIAEAGMHCLGGRLTTSCGEVAFVMIVSSHETVILAPYEHIECAKS